MKKALVGLVGAAALATLTTGMAAASSSMNADQSSSNNAAGIFISGNLGYGTVNNSKSDINYTYLLGAQPNTLHNTGFAWNANIGYQFNKNVAIEGGYTHFGEQKATWTNIGSDNISLSGFGVDAKFIIPVNDQFSVFAKGGAIDMHQKNQASGNLTGTVTGSAWTPEVGAGVAYNVTQNVALNLQDIYTLKTDYNKTVTPVGGVATNDQFIIPSTNSIFLGASYKFNM